MRNKPPTPPALPTKKIALLFRFPALLLPPLYVFSLPHPRRAAPPRPGARTATTPRRERWRPAPSAHSDAKYASPSPSSAAARRCTDVGNAWLGNHERGGEPKQACMHACTIAAILSPLHLELLLPLEVVGHHGTALRLGHHRLPWRGALALHVAFVWCQRQLGVGVGMHACMPVPSLRLPPAGARPPAWSSRSSPRARPPSAGVHFVIFLGWGVEATRNKCTTDPLRRRSCVSRHTHPDISCT